MYPSWLYTDTAPAANPSPFVLPSRDHLAFATFTYPNQKCVPFTQARGKDLKIIIRSLRKIISLHSCLLRTCCLLLYNILYNTIGLFKIARPAISTAHRPPPLPLFPHHIQCESSHIFRARVAAKASTLRAIVICRIVAGIRSFHIN